MTAERTAGFLEASPTRRDLVMGTLPAFCSTELEKDSTAESTLYQWSNESADRFNQLFNPLELYRAVFLREGML